VASAAAELLSRRALEVDIVFLIEGEEENGSAGFKDAVQKHKVMLSLRSKKKFANMEVISRKLVT